MADFNVTHEGIVGKGGIHPLDGLEYLDEGLRTTPQPFAGGFTKLSKLIPTQEGLYRSQFRMQQLIDDIKVNGVREPIKYVEYNGSKYIVDGHHRYFAAQKLGISQVPIEKVTLPFRGYQNPSDLFPGKILLPKYWNKLKW